VNAQALSGEESVEAGLASTDAALTMLLSQLQLNEKISQREQSINQIKGRIREEETKRSWIKPTRAEDIAVASLSPVGTSRALIAVLGAMLGGMLGIFMAFMVEFAARVRESEDGRLTTRYVLRARPGPLRRSGFTACSRAAGINPEEVGCLNQYFIFTDQPGLLVLGTGEVQCIQCSEAGLPRSDPGAGSVVVGIFYGAEQEAAMADIVMERAFNTVGLGL